MTTLFTQRVWELGISIPEGRVTTYGSIAKAAGGGGQSARSVSAILSKFPNQGVVPWHRIVYAGGRVWLNNNNEEKSLELYEMERIYINEKGYIKNFEEIFYDFSELT